MKLIRQQLAFNLVLIFSAVTAVAQSVPDRDHLPIPDPDFHGEIGRTFEDSTPDFPRNVKAPNDAPNIVVIMLDDVGFGQAGTFGGPIPTPGIDQLAAQGLRYNRFHTVGVCSPTRAALLTGHNHHTVGFGTITELSTGYPGYDSVFPKKCANIARILKENGYSTAMFGKNHNTPDWESNPVGPFDNWPTGWGFEHFYGFNGGETSQWEPQLYHNTNAVEPEKRPEDGYHLTADLADRAIAWISTHESVDPDKPYFLYFATGAMHAPHHAPQEWIDKFKGQFDGGWDEMRSAVLVRQKELGIVPQNTRLTPRPEELAAWDSLDADSQRLFARQMEVFAGFLAHTDHHVNRLIEAVQEGPDAENTMIIYIVGDNGASAEGSVTGTLNNIRSQNGIPDSVERQLNHIDQIGTPLAMNHYAVPWSWAGCSPFQWMKRVPSHFGGTRNGMVVVWPKVIKERGGLRDQFGHVVDIAPTILAAANVPAPRTVDGIEQIPMAGKDMSGTFASADAPEYRQTQYFETGGHRAIYHDGWVAATFHGAPWVLTGSVGFTDPKYNTWELYNIDEDFSQATDLAEQHPEKLEQLKALFDREAEKYGVFPLDDRFVERGMAQRPSVVEGRTEFRYSATTRRIPEGSAPPIHQRSHKITAKLTIPETGAEGVIIARGGITGGYSLYVRDGKLHYDYNFVGEETYRVESTTDIPSGEVVVAMHYEQRPFKPLVEHTGGPAELFINGKSVGKGEIEKVIPVRFAPTETLDIGLDLGSPASPAYRGQYPFAFTGKIQEVMVSLK
ncbi:MAG: arylsulfatase [Planctomycetota bacterium]|nr:MAG: arylsulfatase [Planctomycetota bacterium]REK18293.1 MAG: arylsulfatase [Planctomycetota bacterium]REK49163.1 MAG: arylsulfatase [Planctomycetota bacterium]